MYNLEPTRDEFGEIENSSDFIRALFNSSFMATLLTLSSAEEFHFDTVSIQIHLALNFSHLFENYIKHYHQPK